MKTNTNSNHVLYSFALDFKTADFLFVFYIKILQNNFKRMEHWTILRDGIILYLYNSCIFVPQMDINKIDVYPCKIIRLNEFDLFHHLDFVVDVIVELEFFSIAWLLRFWVCVISIDKRFHSSTLVSVSIWM